MSDLDVGTLFHNMGKILLAVLVFALSFIPIGALALLSAWLCCFEERAHFFQRKLPKTETSKGFLVALVIAHCAVTFFLAIVWSSNGTSAMTVITYSVAIVITVVFGLCLGGLILGTMWHIFQTNFVNKSASGESGSYQPVATTNEHELESGAPQTDESTAASTKA
ncbi:hypothetical protein M409DRAFT_28903 [Zasmidium cellare ATCC 36951]|uniref:Uncharacterized protein n=1 Tax=Zasmidium cellare ATCC 36951 TaxID=1080233 RepID=A0A6A6C3A6_ZASCE|nr:uncharacterized protein M409DRAFT_28903 [Zasmidium cellare ATCC 36951]KAF2160768.1 hypothetical protein M409DRAFT_28903 [Zasmidium cellare ATCC 36951]